MAAPARTYLAFQHNAKLSVLQTLITAIHPFSALSETNRASFKTGAPSDHVVITSSTIFHPQGGGQSSDTGTMHTTTAHFSVHAVRMDAAMNGQVLHLGRFASVDAQFSPGETATQAIDADKRLLYSRLHTAGHVLGAAVRHLLQERVPGFEELKASHFPDSAACEFQGLIEGGWKEAIQRRVDECVGRAMLVQIEWWDEADFRAEGLGRLVPDREAMGMAEGEKFRVVRIVGEGGEVYPCGGTHVDTTEECGKTTVRKISRSKGTSRVSYAVE